jgi:agmatine deiminase
VQNLKTEKIIVALPMQEVEFDGLRLPASYVIFDFKQMCLVPTFNDSNDRKALNILAECFQIKLSGINATDFLFGFGTLHCFKPANTK